MTQVNNEQKESMLKVMAIVGFLAAIVLLVFIAVKVVSFIPSAFSSLASIADSVYNYERNTTLTVATPNTVIKTGEAFVMNWTNIKRPGTYSFIYACTPGASVDVRNTNNDIITIDCNTPFALDKDQTTLEISVTTEKQRFTDIPYSIAFTPSDPRQEALATDGRITIVNASIPTSATATPDVVETPVVAKPTPVVVTPTIPTPAPVTPVTPKPTYIEHVIYALPVSNPNGVVDLRVTLVGVGTTANGTFTTLPQLDTNEAGAIRFTVKNIGTKTAEDWSYKANLPSDISYTSGEQKDLKPNEEAIITLGFTGIDRTGVESFDITVQAKNDVTTKNNSFTWAVKVVN